MTRKRYCDRCEKEIPSEDKYIKCVEVGEPSSRDANWTRTMNHSGDICLVCWKRVIKK
jgi:hypothetical protein